MITEAEHRAGPAPREGSDADEVDATLGHTVGARVKGAPIARSRGRTWQGLKRGARGRCPNCGEGHLFRAYLKVKIICEVCGHDNDQYPVDDAAPYFTILIVGHLIVAPLLAFPFIWTWPVGVVLAIVLPSVLVLTLVLLPIVKGSAIGVLWALGKSPAS
jgi:uncharacterized protein (DUF983 family)